MRKTALLIGASIFASTTSGAFAQDAAADGYGAPGDDIIVTARRKDERLLDVPVAVTALSGDTLESKRIDNVEGLRFVAPSLQVTGGAFGKSVPGYTLRGQRSLESLITQDPAVGVYFAEVVQQRPHGTNSALYDLESVEVLKGPQGTLFGRNTTGGAILINPAKPKFDFEGMAQIEVGNYDLIRGTAVINLPLSETLAVRAAGRITRRDGFVEHTVGRPNNNPFQNEIRTRLGFDAIDGSTAGYDSDDEKTEAARLSLLWEPNDTFSSHTIASYFHQDDHGTGFATGAYDLTKPFPVFFPGFAESVIRQADREDFYSVEANFHPAQKVKTWSISNTSAVELGGVTIKNIFGYRDIKVSGLYDFDTTPETIFESGNKLDAFQLTEEFQVSGNLSENVNFITGLFWFYEDGRDTQYSILFGTRANDGRGKNESASAYAQFGIGITDQLNLTVGGRYTWDKRQLFAFNRLNGQCRIVDDAGKALDPCIKAFVDTFTSPSWLVSLDYKPNNDMLLYLAHRRGYRAGGWNLRANRSTEQISFAPEDVYDIEAGFKGQLMNGALTMNAAVFQQWYKNIQRTVSFIPPGDSNLATVVLNAATAEIRGGELELSGRFGDFLQLNASVAHVDASYSNFLTPAGDYSNSQFAQTPRWTYTLGATAFIPVDPSMGEVSVGASFYKQGKMWLTDLNTLTVNGNDTFLDSPSAGYEVLDVFFDWKNLAGMPIDLGLYAKNVLKEKYYTGGSSVLGSLGNTFLSFGAPRQFGASLTYRFGAMAD